MAKVRAKNSSKAKSTRKFAQSGQLDKQIKERRARQQKKSQIDNRKALKQRASYGDKASTTTGSSNKNGKDGAAAVDGDEDDEDLEDGDEDDDQVMDEETLEALLADSDADDVAELENDDDEDDHAQGGSDLEDLEGEEERHKVSLQALKDKDPEFYKYLEENDPALLGFGDDDEDDEVEDDTEDVASTKKSKKGKEKATKVKATVLNKELLATWQTQMLKQRSLKALRKLLIAFRTAASIEDEDEATSSSKSSQQQQKEVYTIPNALMFNKVVTAALKYTPLVLGYHVPVKEQANGKFKVPTQSKKYATAQRIVKNYFTSLHSLFSSLSSTSNASLLQLSITESGRLIPYLVGNRKISKEHIKHLLNYWATSNDDSIKLSAFLSLRTLALAGDASIFELVVKGTYLAIGQVSKNTTVFTLPSITLMKNSASSLFVNNNSNSTASGQAYQLAFSYIRQLAVTLRNSMKATPKSSSGGGANAGANGAGKGKGSGSGEQYRQVYSWQFVHSIDFWSLVLATACDTDRETEQAKESELRPLIYPLVQLTLGVIRLVPTSRYFPLRFQLVTSLLRIVQRTGVYVPLAPVLLEIFDSSEFSGKPKGSSLKPLDWAYYIRAPAAYPKTRVYSDALADETIYLLLEFFASQSTSIAFPELSIPVTVTLRRHIKKTRNSKLSNGLKALVERLESNAKWIEEKRANIDFSPQDREQIDSFLSGKGDDAATPLRSYLKLQRKVRDQRREVLEKSLAGDEDSEAEMGEEMDEDDE